MKKCIPILTAPLFIISSLLFFAPILGCSSSKKEAAPEPVELGDTTSVDTPEGELFREAQKFYNARLFSNAREAFEKIRDGYPFGPFAEYAEIKIADCYFYAHEYSTSALLYDEFTKQRPASPNVSYAIVQMGRSYQLQYKGNGRDVDPLEKAAASYKKLLEEKPDAIYAAAAKKYLGEIQKEILAYEQIVENFYKRAGKEEAAKARATRKLALKENYKSEMEKINQQTVEKRGGVEVPELYTSSTSNKANQVGSPSKNLLMADKSSYRITRVQCHPEKDQIYLFLNREPSPDDDFDKNDISIKNNLLTINFPDTSSENIKINCFGTGDLSISESATVNLKTNKQATLLQLKNPPRILVALD